METPTNRLHVAGIFLLDPPAGDPVSADARFERIRTVIAQRLERVPRLLRRPIRTPFDLQPPAWVEEPDIDIDAHVRRAVVREPGGAPELDALVGELLGADLPLDRPLWEMVVVDGVQGGRMAVVARLHHAILDGVAGATAMAAFLDLAPVAESGAAGGAESGAGRVEGPGGGVTVGARSAEETRPSSLDMWRYAAASLGPHLEAALAAMRRSADALVELAAQNRELTATGTAPSPSLFSAPRTSLNGNVSGQRCYATLAVPLADIMLVRQAFGDGITVNDVILCAVGGALIGLLERRGDHPERSLVALVPVSTRGKASVPQSGRADVGNDVSGMLVSLGTTTRDSVERLREVAQATRIAKRQEERSGGDFLEAVARTIPPIVTSGLMRGMGRFGLFDRFPPPFNVVVSSVVVPDVDLFWAGCPVTEIYPGGPVAAGVGLNVTSMTYKGTVHFGLVGCPALVPDIDMLAVLLDDAIAELVTAALGTQRPHDQRRS